jgi:UDP-N-acetylmuramate--alanine ligase
VLGAHNVHNALLAIAVAREIFGLDFSVISSALNGFLGVKRRFESLGEKNGINFVADYAHHPKEIEKALELADEIWGSDYAIIFQPHTYSRTEILFTDFLNVFSSRSPLVFKTYAAREKYTFLGSAERLSLKLDNSWYFEDFSELTFFIDNNVKVKNVLVLGAGDLYENIKNYVKTADK